MEYSWLNRAVYSQWFVIPLSYLVKIIGIVKIVSLNHEVVEEDLL